MRVFSEENENFSLNSYSEEDMVTAAPAVVPSDVIVFFA